MRTYSASKRIVAAIAFAAFIAFSHAASAGDYYIPGVPDSGTGPEWDNSMDPADAARVRYSEYADEVRESSRILDQSENVPPGIVSSDDVGNAAMAAPQVQPGQSADARAANPVTIVIVPTRDPRGGDAAADSSAAQALPATQPSAAGQDSTARRSARAANPAQDTFTPFPVGFSEGTYKFNAANSDSAYSLYATPDGRVVSQNPHLREPSTFSPAVVRYYPFANDPDGYINGLSAESRSFYRSAATR